MPLAIGPYTDASMQRSSADGRIGAHDPIIAGALTNADAPMLAAHCTGPDCCGTSPHPICFHCKRQPPHVPFSLAQYERHTRRTQSKGNGKHVYCQICCPPLNPLTSKKRCSICGNQDLSDTQKRKNADERRCKECRNAGAA